MMRPRLVSAQPAPLSPERAALAEAIAAHAERQAEMKAAGTALSKASEARRQTMQDLMAAEAVTDDASERFTAWMIAQAKGEVGEAPLTGAQAAQRVADAKLRHDAAKAAEEALKAAFDTAQQYEAMLADRVVRARSEVVRLSPEVKALLSDVMSLKTALIEKLKLVDWLVGREAQALQRTPPLTRVPMADGQPTAEHQAVTMLVDASQWCGWGRLDEAPPELVQPWRAALAALTQDATAPLPASKEK